MTSEHFSRFFFFFSFFEKIWSDGLSRRPGESEKFKKDLHNKQLLWHGSRTTNYAGILTQGLRIAPPEAPVTGYMFGKGVYFADMSSKSANYTHTSKASNTVQFFLFVFFSFFLLLTT